MSTEKLPLIDILMVDDDEADVLLTRRALDRNKVYRTFNVARDGIEALRFLRQEGEHAQAPRPDLILLDLNMPRKDGRETLNEIKADDRLKDIPVMVLTTSDAEIDVAVCYGGKASCFISKPVDYDKFLKVVGMIEKFWLRIVRLPPK